MRLEEDDSGAEAPSRGADMYHCNGAGKLGLIIPPPSPSSYRRRGGAELRAQTADTHNTTHMCPVCVVTRTEDQEQWVTTLHWRLCIMFSSTLAINLVASAKFYFLSGGHLATDRTQQSVQQWLLHISVTRAAQGAAAVQLRWSAHDTGRPNERTGPGSVGTYHQHHQHQMQMLLSA